MNEDIKKQIQKRITTYIEQMALNDEYAKSEKCGVVEQIALQQANTVMQKEINLLEWVLSLV